MRRSQVFPIVATVALLLYFWANGLAYLDRFPPVNPDEPLVVAPGYTFWDKGVFGTSLFAGYYNEDKHLYSFMPIFPLIAGGGMQLFGMGLFQARLASLTMIMLTLALTYRLGAALFSALHGALAVFILVGWQIAAPQPHLDSGIPLADVARIARYDCAVPVFGLAATLVAAQSLKRRNPRTAFFVPAGALAGLATLSHLYGAFWLPALLLAALWIRRGRAFRPAAALMAGFTVTMTPWLVFVASGWSDFRGQYREYAPRFDLLDLRFYTNNITSEIQRYQPLVDAVQKTAGSRLWLSLLGLGLILLVRRARKDLAARLLLSALLALGILFAALLDLKTFSYLATLWSLLALVVAFAIVRLWEVPSRAGRAMLVGVCALAFAEGVVDTQHLHEVAQTTTPYSVYTTEIARHLPPNSRVLALHSYWLGLAEGTQDYRSLLAPIDASLPRYSERPISFEAAADAARPQYILVDQPILNLLAETAQPASTYFILGESMRRYLARAALISQFYDPTYGWMRIYQISVSSP
jgi:4-amino-4-deoxy-L-arabinose transferase-like glycosyltransferase